MSELQKDPQIFLPNEVPEVKITIPFEAEERELRVVLKNPLISLPSTPDFDPIRPVINFGLAYHDEEGDGIDFSFKSNIMIEVTCHPADMYRAAKMSGRYLKLGYWDGDQWVILNTPEKETWSDQLDAYGSAKLEVRLNHWPRDPQVAWGD
jgi:hypothetical protein